MNTDRKNLYILTSVILVALSFILFLPINFTKVLTAVILTIFCVTTCLLIKKRGTLSFNKNEVLMLISIIGLLYIMIYYLSGLKFGFYKSLTRFSINSLFMNIIPIAMSIIAIEIIRNILLAQKNIVADIMTFITCILVEVLMFNNIRNINNFNQFMDLMGLTLFPAITFNLLYTYLSKRFGVKPNIVLRLMITLFPYIIPIESGIPDSLFAFFKLLIPLIIYIFISALYEKKVRKAVKRQSKLSYVFSGALIVVMISIVMIISGQFKIGSVVIGSESMTGELNVGDIAIYEKYNGEFIEEGQVIIFKRRNSLIIHRVVKIECVNGEYRFYTKGDANEDLDFGYITKEDIVGVSDFKISYLGYPTIWIRDMFD